MDEEKALLILSMLLIGGGIALFFAGLYVSQVLVLGGVVMFVAGIVLFPGA